MLLSVKLIIPPSTGQPLLESKIFEYNKIAVLVLKYIMALDESI